MANTATPGNGFMVVTQVIPSATEGQHAAGPGPGVATVRVPNVGVHNVHVPTVGVPYVEVHNVPFVTPVSNSTTAPAPNPLQVFRRSKPTALGTVQIMIGVVCFLMSTVLSIEELPFSIYSGITYWGPTFYIISGSLTVAAEKHLTSCLVKGSLGMNVCSAVFAGLAIILLLMDFAVDLEFYDCDCYLLDDCSCEVNQQLMTVEITIGVITVVLGIALTIIEPTLSVYTGFVYWGSVIYIVAGSLSVAAGTKLSPCLVKASLGMNVVSAMVGGISFFLLGSDVGLVRGNSFYYSCKNEVYEAGLKFL
ncbi:hypothetical protein NFI96_034111, partial [Prochilodus magdalenae]